MPRGPRPESKTGYYHWINRGVNQKKLFHFRNDFQRFLELVKEYKEIYEVSVYHYCLMSNHVHMLISVKDRESLFKFSYYIQRRYAYYYCRTYKWKGQVFQRMYKSLPIEKDAYLLECGRYIERNPVRAKLVKAPGDWKPSSYSFYAYGKKNELLDESPVFIEMARMPEKRRLLYREYVNEERVYEEMVDRVLINA